MSKQEARLLVESAEHFIIRQREDRLKETPSTRLGSAYSVGPEKPLKENFVSTPDARLTTEVAEK